MSLPVLPFATPTVLLYSIVIAAGLIYLPFVVVAYGRFKVGFQAFVTPRAVVEKLPSWAQRATWAHQNAFETFALFSVAALMAYTIGVQSSTAAWAAIAFIIARSLYPVFYILNILVGRSLTFAVGMVSTATLFFLSLLQVSHL